MALEPTNANSGIQGPAQLFTLIISLLARTLVSSEHNSLVAQSGTLYLSDHLNIRPLTLSEKVTTQRQIFWLFVSFSLSTFFTNHLNHFSLTYQYYDTHISPHTHGILFLSWSMSLNGSLVPRFRVRLPWCKNMQHWCTILFAVIEKSLVCDLSPFLRFLLNDTCTFPG